MKHAKHICINCSLPIDPEDPEVRVDTKLLVSRVVSRGGKVRRDMENPVRYAHASYEVCAQAEARAAAW